MKRQEMAFWGAGIFLILLGTTLYAFASVSENDLAYRKATLEALVAESHREKNYQARDLHHSLPYFENCDKPDTTELEPAPQSYGDVAGA